MLIVCYVSGHGFGHASRDIELLHAITALRPDVRVLVRTSVPCWLFAPLGGAAVDVQAVETDSGVIQIDSLRLDEEATARAAARFYAAFERRVAAEAALLRGAGADVVIADVPPLAFAAAGRAGVPSIAVANFTWDWIYELYPAFDRLAPEALPAIRRAYATATRALRLPIHGGFAPMATVTRDIPLIARRSSREPGDTRRRLGWPSDRPVVLPSFGRYGADLPRVALKSSHRFALVEAPADLPAGLRYQDLVAAADVVVSKPGYGIVSECVANRTALLYTSRGRFAEYDVFVAEMPRLLRCRFLSQDDLLAGRWAEAIDRLLGQPPPPTDPAVNGAEVAARAVLEIAGA